MADSTIKQSLIETDSVVKAKLTFRTKNEVASLKIEPINVAISKNNPAMQIDIYEKKLRVYFNSGSGFNNGVVYSADT